MDNKTSLAVVITVAVLILGAAIFASATSRKTPEPKEITLTGSVSISFSNVFITNLDDFDWEGVSVYVNGYDFTQDVRSIASGKTVSLPLMEFSTRSGDRFNPLLKKVIHVYVYSQKPLGSAGYEIP
jgi:hypothetical protein